MAWTFSSERETVDFVPRTMFCYCHFDTDLIFSTILYKLQNVIKYTASNIESWLIKINLNAKLRKITQFYNECLQLGTSPKQWDTKLGVTHTHDVLSVNCWQVVFFDFFSHNAYVFIFAKTNALFNYIVNKTNQSFSLYPCPICDQSDLAI